MGAGMWATTTSMAHEAMSGIEGVFDSSSLMRANGGGGVAASEVAASPNHGLTAAGKDPDWWHEGLKKVMPLIMGAAMRPKQQAHSSAGGHAVQANPAGVMKPFEEVEKMASDNPLDGLTQFTHLF